jgi:hypothetical protein
MKEVPLPSERWTTTMSASGSLTPGFCAVMAGSFHLVTVPRKMAAKVGPSRFSWGLPSTL